MFKKLKTFLINISVSVVTVVIMLATIEFAYNLFLRKLFQKPVPIVTGTLYQAVQPDTLLGFRPYGKAFQSGKKTFLDTLIYSMSYHLDTNGHRVTPDSLTTKEKFAIFWGCSFTFGDGLNDNETIPFYFSKNSGNYQGYNFGYSGFGPNHALIKLQHDSLSKNISQKDGIGFFVFIHDHVNRTIGSMSNYAFNQGKSPDFEIENNQVVHKGFFRDVHPTRTWFYSKMAGSSFFRFFKIGHPFRLNEEHFTLTAKVLEEISKEYQKQFHNDQFYVIMYPSMYPEDYEADENIINYLKANKIKYLDYRKLFNPVQKGNYIPHDNHPSASANDILTKQILKDLKMSD
jgi:hypothetical protein